MRRTIILHLPPNVLINDDHPKTCTWNLRVNFLDLTPHSADCPMDKTTILTTILSGSLQWHCMAPIATLSIPGHLKPKGLPGQELLCLGELS